jgi:hypothetical protein
VTWEKRDLIFLRGMGWGKVLQNRLIPKKLGLVFFIGFAKK